MELYLDANAHLPTSQSAINAYIKFNSSKAGHGHPLTPSEPGMLAAKEVELARATIGELLGARTGSAIIFCANCTQGCEWAMKILRKLGRGSIKISPTEHPAIYQPFENNFGSELYFKHDKNGIYIDENHYEKVVCVAVQNEIGIIQPIKDIKRSYLLSDMCQAVGKIDINLDELNVDIAIFGAHKFGGPGGVGIVYLKDASWWEAIGTGSQYKYDRPGTTDAAGIIATAAALQDAVETKPQRMLKAVEFMDVLEPGLEELGFKVIAKDGNRVPTTTFVQVPGSATKLMFELGQKGIYVGLGSACGSLRAGPSKLMVRLGYSCSTDDFIRISQWGEYGAKEARYILDLIGKIHG